ncbi:hypothetical protein Dtox_1715 [Desulfofarcimen acetoxidans DSM 771]|uniref:Uncharacterized protein n=1 Tax=Desulfofarcimen acetoxidans (strain ATCC 49208 / DSM 771 / KCTC 5769 / VKM B-1644 / 5575) TaxID=485916 RepID=C8VWZ6_DESAS|nr:hypothetical protein [Desulfofarcimen acetoxidans]ACV62572.1 hypothetical protein Dtox_1715 [Desulfofarcimen acetoxidans DSM 771]
MKILTDNRFGLHISQVEQTCSLADSSGIKTNESELSIMASKELESARATISELFDAAKLVLKTFHRKTGLSMSEEFALNELYQVINKLKVNKIITK